MNWDDLQYEKTPYKIHGNDCYAQSKLAQILNAFEIAKRFKDTGVTAASLHPGVVATDIFRTRGQDATGFKKVLSGILRPCVRLFGLSVADGAKTTIYCATSDEIPKNNGKYFA